MDVHLQVYLSFHFKPVVNASIFNETKRLIQKYFFLSIINLHNCLYLKFPYLWNCWKDTSIFFLCTEKKVFSDEKRGNTLYSAQIPSFSSSLDQVWNILFPNILLKRGNQLIRGKLSALHVVHTFWWCNGLSTE
jgi:hypothetical protein